MSKRWMKSNRHRRHTACALGRLSRRLRAELLEGRMMLSAATVTSVTPMTPDAEYFSRLQAEFTATDWILTQPTQELAFEGGFVTAGALYTVSASTQVSGLYSNSADLVFSGNASQVLRSHFDSDVTMVDLLDISTPLSPAGGFEVWTEYDWSSDTGYVPQVFDSPAAESGLSPVVQPISDEVGGGASHDGGAISIKWPTTPTNPDVEPKQPEPSLAALLINSQDSAYGQKPANNNRMSSAPAVSGEWARAAVFEIAGGEPLAENAPSHDQRSQPDDSTSDHSAPESSNMSDAKSNMLRKDLNIAQVPVDSASVTEVEPTDAAARETLATLDDAALLDLTSIALLDEHAATMNGGVSQVSAHSDDALAAAFDQLDGDDLAIASTMSDRVRVNWLSGTPLLLMFALERVTARKSRNRQMNIVGEERPRE
jgi:hypothetical protein